MRRIDLDLIVTPGRALCGSIHLPGDKSISHRAALFASLADGESHFENFLVAGVTEAMLKALSVLGVPWRLQGTSLTVAGKTTSSAFGRAGERAEALSLDCGNSATTMRLLAGALAANNVPTVLDGSEGLRRRPMKRIIEPLRRMGVAVEATDDKAPLVFQTSELPLHAIEHRLPVASAQVKSCLLLAGLSADGPVGLVEPGPSRDHSERMLRMMGVQVESQKFLEQGRVHYQTRLTPPAGQRLAPLELRIPGDFSAAAFLIVAALITPGSELTLKDIGLNPTRTGLLDVLQAMRGAIEVSPKQGNQEFEHSGDITVRYSELHGTVVAGDQVVRMIDEFPAFAVAAAYAQGETLVKDAEELRHKESDRIASVCNELRTLGADIQETADGFLLQGQNKLRGGEVQSHLDHRLAMALAVAGLASDSPVRVRDGELYHESFPEFVETLRGLGAQIGEEDG